MLPRMLLPLAALLLAGCQPPVDIARIEDERRFDSPELIRALERGRSAQRARAALAMGRIQSMGYAPMLARAASGDDRDVRLAALFALGQLGLARGAEISDVAYDACAAALDDGDPQIALRALEALGKLATAAAVEVVRPFLEHDDPRLRAEAATALFRCRFVPLWRGAADEPPPLPQAALAALIGALQDPEIVVRQAAAHAFARYGQPEATLELAALVSDGDVWTRLFAVRALGRSGDAALADVLLRATLDTSHRVRTEAVAALVALERAALLPAALAADPSVAVRAALARALGQSDGDETLATLRALEQDESVAVRVAVLAALARRLGTAYRPELEARLADEDWRLRAAAAGAAAHLDAQAMPLVTRALDDRDTRVRTAALGALGQLGTGDELILAALGADDLAVRGTAVGLLAERDHPDKLARLESAYEGSAGEAWIEIREALVEALADLEGTQALLGRIARDDPAASVRAAARTALPGEAFPPAADPPIEASEFLRLEFDEDPVVRLETTKGPIEIRCLAGEAPLHVAAFVERVREGFYDGLAWHRVVPNFVIQGGDPRGDGWGSGGWVVRDEINTERYRRGTVGMPKAGKDTGGCQIFITHVPTPHLDGNYTVFGRVVSGLDVIDRIEVGDAIVRAELLP